MREWHENDDHAESGWLIHGFRFFLIFNLACGFAQNDAQMLAFRFLSGLGACAPQTIGGGVISDLWTSEERGKAVALYALTPVMGEFTRCSFPTASC